MFDPVSYDTYFEYVEKIDNSVINRNLHSNLNSSEYQFTKQEIVELFSSHFMERDIQLLVLL